MNKIEKSASLVALARQRACQDADKVAYTFLNNGDLDTQPCTYAELDLAARDTAVALRQYGATGERVMLLFPPGLDFVKGFFGCLYAGAVATPVYPPQDIRHLDRLQAIIKDCDAKVILTTSALAGVVDTAAATIPALRRLAVLATGAVNEDRAAAWIEPKIDSHSIALLQYTSGSTGEPKGVMLSHGNLLHNQELIGDGFRDDVEMVGLSWLPMYHDMGLIGHIVQPLYQGIHSLLMSPLDFLKRPASWLEAITRFKVTTSGGPNFAYELCLRRISAEQRAALDLSSWTLAYSGAEPVRAQTIERFSDAFASCGFRREAFYPCYGLAEATLFVSGGRRRDWPVIGQFDRERLVANQAVPVTGAEGTGKQRSLVGCGQIPEGLQVVIVSPETGKRLPDGQVGEIWVKGESVARGYWNNPQGTEEVFGARLAETGEGPFLRTGDLGFLLDGELYVSSRLKDLLIIRGRNHYPQDIEQTVESSHSSFRAGCCAAFTTEIDGEERLVVLQEVKPQSFAMAEAAGVVRSVAQRVASEHGIHLYELILVEPRTLPKTSSGKIRRSSCHALWKHERLEAIYKGEALTDGGEPDRLPGEPPAGPIESKLAELWRGILGISTVSRDDNFFHLGADSIKSVELAYALEESFGLNLPASVLYEYPTLRSMAEVIAADGAFTRVSNLPEQVRLDPEIQPPTAARTDQAYRRIFLTGATGFLGTFLLNDLLKNTDAIVHCLVRASSKSEGAERLQDAFARVGLTLQGLHERVVVITGDLAEYRFGLDGNEFHALATQVDSIIHCAAMVDWVRPYRDLHGPNVIGTHEVLRLAGTATTKPVHHISTLWVFTPDRKKRGQIWWEHDDNPDWRTLETGYNQSKWVAEQLVYEAMRRGFPASVYRMDFIIGLSTNGIMKVTDFIPRIMRDVVELGCLPLEQVAVDLIPGDFLSRMIMALAMRPESIGKTFHLSNPDRLTVSSLTEILRSFGYTIERIPLDEWKRRVAARPENALFPLRDFLAMYDSEFIEISDQARIDTTVSVSALNAAAPGLVQSIPPMKDLVFRMLAYLHEQKLISKAPRDSE